jgi:hypothetical protein
MPRWQDVLDKLLGLQRPPEPKPQARPPERASVDAPINWKAELLKEAEMNWIVPVAEPEPVAEPVVQVGYGAAQLVTPTGPNLGVRREHFALYGYEPGQKPPSLHAFKTLMQQVYDPSLEAIVPKVLEDTALFGALERWNPRDDRLNLTLLRIVFDRLSLHMGDAYGFVPAPLGRVDHDRKRGGFYDPKVKRIFIAASHLTNTPGRVVNTVAHEQAHHLQHLLIERLLYAPQKLSPAERSLALFFYDASHQYVSMHKDFMAYSYNGLEYHARHTGNGLAFKLCPIFGWSPELVV